MLESKQFPREMSFVSPLQRKKSSIGNYLAPPGFWSPWYVIDSIINGAWQYTLTVETLTGGSSFDAEVTYYWEGKRETRSFGIFGAVTFDAGGRREESAFNVKVRLRSHSLGQTVRLRMDRKP